MTKSIRIRHRISSLADRSNRHYSTALQVYLYWGFKDGLALNKYRSTFN